jgi:putative FmdB family regulatory protein
MPLYEYQCDACGHRFELIQKYSDPPPATCPKCGGGVHKEQSSPAFQFKGTGWYVTDYAKKDSGSSSKSDEKAKASESTQKDAPTSESKPEPKKDSGTTPKAG